jgi:arylsulfatase A-like enzyme
MPTTVSAMRSWQVGILVIGSAAVGGGRERQPPPKSPNIVVIVSDDAGYADFSCHGSEQMQTPRIDSIGRDGVRFTAGYVSGAVCSPSRAGLMTGRYQQRFGHEKNIPPRMSQDNGLPLSEQTLADRLRRQGYRTIGLGKWHLGYAKHFHPTARGFDEWFGFLQGSRAYWPLERPTELNRLQRGTEVVAESFDYMTDELGRQAEACITAGKDDPFFLYLAFNAVHTPMHALESDLEVVEAETPRRRKLIAMTKALDRAVGQVLDALDREGLADDTIVFFVNDNGGATNNACSNGPLRGHKGQVWEGGIRVPFLMRWPARVAAGQVCDVPVIALDIAATGLAAAGCDVSKATPQLDGCDIVPVVTGAQRRLAREALFWRHGDRWAVRSADLKLVRQEVDRPPMLFDLARDPGEQKDLAGERSGDRERLQGLVDAWMQQLVDPLW